MTEPGAVWVISDIAPDGTYVLTVHVGEDAAWSFTRDMAMEYASAVIAAATRATYDAAVFAQQVAIGGRADLAAGILGDIRLDRPEIAFPAPLSLVPFVAVGSHEPGLVVRVNGTVIGQWTPDDARGHALNVLEVAAGVDLDAGYRRFLVGTLGLDDGRARQVVGALSLHLNGATL